MSNEPIPFENPYTAPQSELRPSASAGSLVSAAHTKYLRQGIVAGMQLGGVAASIAILAYILMWDDNSTVLAFILIPAGILFFFTLIGFLIGFAVQLIALLFGVTPNELTLPSLPFPSLEPPEYSANQELDKAGHYPPPPLN